MKAITLEREFHLKQKDKNIVLQDPNPDYTLSQVADILSNEYPEILNGNFEGPKHIDGKLVYKIKSTYGTKG